MAAAGSTNGVSDSVTPADRSIGDSRWEHRDHELLTVAEAARTARRSVRTLRRAYLAGRLVAHRDGNGRGVTIRYADLVAWLTADVIRPPSVAGASRPIAHVDVRDTNAPVETGNLALLSAARGKRTAHARVSAAPASGGAARSGRR